MCTHTQCIPSCTHPHSLPPNMHSCLYSIHQGTQLTVEAKEWMDKKIKENPAFAEKMDMRELAKKSLSSANWAGELMKGSSTKFASKGQVSVEDSLKHQTVGLVTYDDYKRKKQEIELQLGEGGGADGGGGGEGGGAVAGSKKRKVTKKCNLSFDADKDD